jgi:DNA polymerase
VTQLLIIGEAWGREEEAARAPFVGASGKLLRGNLARVGIDPAETAFTNVFNLRPQPSNDVLNLCGPRAEGIPEYPALGPAKYIRAEYAPELARLETEVAACDPNLILCLGNTAIIAATKQKYPVGTHRGTLFQTRFLHPDGEPIKAIATYHPAAVLRDWSQNMIVVADLQKVKRQMGHREFTRPRRELWIEPDLGDLTRFANLRMTDLDEPCGVDIETQAGTITEIGFGYPDMGIVVPFYSRARAGGNYWPSHGAERVAWDWVIKRLAHLRRPVFQNGLYDINYLMTAMGITVPGAGEDTMLLHHSLQPELRKSLGFLGSMHTDEPSWKLMRKNATLKKED